MSKIIKGTGDMKSQVFLKVPQGGVAQARCPCGGISVPAIDARTGAKTRRCGKCGKQTITRRM